MSVTVVALFFKSTEISERALSLGFAVALAGWDVPAPKLLVGALPESEFSVAFYSSGVKGEAATEHVIDLFEEEVSPLVAVLDAAEMLGAGSENRIFALVYAEDFLYDDGWQFGPFGYERHFVRDGEEGIEAGVETPDVSDLDTVELDIPEGATEAEERALEDATLRPHRGTTFLEKALGKGVLQRVMRASFEADKRVAIRFVEPDAASIEAETKRLVGVLGRVVGRGAEDAPVVAGGAAQPPSVAAFVGAYDWADPADPGDLYRELAIGNVVGNLRFLRAAEVLAFQPESGWKSPRGEALYPVAKLVPSALGGRSEAATLAVAPDGESMFRLRPGRPPEAAGPTFGELLRYLALGWSKRSPAEEELIGALMLRARLRAGG